MNVPNVYIFNKIENNDADVELLHETFKFLGCTVKELKNGPLYILKCFVQNIVQADFSSFKYVVIIIMDNTNEDYGIWISTDNFPFHINGDLLTPLYANKSLKGKLRLAIIQTNRCYSDLEPKKHKQRIHNVYPCIDVKYFATSIGCKLTHEWEKTIPSNFIKILCEEFRKSSDSQKTIREVLNNISRRVQDQTKEIPSTESSFDCPFIHACEQRQGMN